MARSVSSRLDAWPGRGLLFFAAELFFVDVFFQGRLSENSFAATVRRIDIICMIRGCSECFDRNKATSVQLPAPEVVRKNGSKQGSKETRKPGRKGGSKKKGGWKERKEERKQKQRRKHASKET